MAERKRAKKDTKTAANRTAGNEKGTKVFTADEREAISALVRERKAGDANAEGAVLAAIAAMEPADRAMAERVHALIKATVPLLSPKTWYGMPAYAKDGKVVCFFQSGRKFKTRYSTFGFNDAAKLDEGDMWPTSFALKKLAPADEERIRTLLKKAVS